MACTPRSNSSKPNSKNVLTVHIGLDRLYYSLGSTLTGFFLTDSNCSGVHRVCLGECKPLSKKISNYSDFCIKRLRTLISMKNLREKLKQYHFQSILILPDGPFNAVVLWKLIKFVLLEFHGCFLTINFMIDWGADLVWITWTWLRSTPPSWWGSPTLLGPYLASSAQPSPGQSFTTGWVIDANPKCRLFLKIHL